MIISALRMATHQAFLKKLGRTLENDDMEAFRKLSEKRTGRPFSSDAAVEIAFHKTRIEMIGHCSKKQRDQSREWLKRRGYGA